MTFAEAQYSFFWQLVATNVQYLAISVSVIIGTGVIFSVAVYFLNFKPLIKRLTDHEASLEEFGSLLNTERQANEKIFSELRSEQETKLSTLIAQIEKNRIDNQDKFTELTTLQGNNLQSLRENLEAMSKIKSEEIAEVKNTTLGLIKTVDRNIKELEVLTSWQEHYVWETHKVPTNIISTIISCLEKSAAHKVYPWIIPMGLKEIERTLNDYPNAQLKDKRVLEDIEKLIIEHQKGNEEVVVRIQARVSEINAT